MSFERALFAPVERAALALYPHRWRFALATLALFLVPLVLVIPGYLGWQPAPAHLLQWAAPILLTLVAWVWSTFLLAMWFGPSQRFPSLSAAARPKGLLAAVWVAARILGLLFLALFALSPVFMWLLLWLPR